MKIRENLSGKVINNREILEIVGKEPMGYHSLYKVKCLNCNNIYISTKESTFNETLLSNLDLLYTFEALNSAIFDSIGGRIIENPELFDDVLIN